MENQSKQTKQTKEIKIKTITPMLSHGANTNKPEIRIPEFKAAMRFWWRALGSFKDIADMREKEGILFGDSEKNASPLTIKLNNRCENKVKTECVDLKFGKKKMSPNLIIEDQDFNLIFKLRYPDILNSKKNKDILKNLDWSFDDYVNLFYIVSILGGIGGRLRKGYGSFCIDQVGQNKQNIFTNSMDVINKVKSLLDKCKMKDFEVDKENLVIKRQEYNENKLKKYPCIEKIHIGSPLNKEVFYKKITRLTLNNPIDYNPYRERRFACPIYISCVQNENKEVIPVISILENTVLKDEKKYKRYKNKIEEKNKKSKEPIDIKSFVQLKMDYEEYKRKFLHSFDCRGW